MLRTVTSLVIMLAAAGSTCSDAVACSGPPPPSVEVAYDHADAVYLGFLTSVRHEREPGQSDAQVVTERATFTILVTFKGTKEPTDTVAIETHNLGPPGMCGGSVVNNPQWASVDSATPGGKAQPAKFSDVWLLYLQGNEPYAIDPLGRSQPLNFVEAAELKQLYANATRGRHET